MIVDELELNVFFFWPKTYVSNFEKLQHMMKVKKDISFVSLNGILRETYKGESKWRN